MELFSQEGFNVAFRWGHILAGIAWIGLLYYFNFVQVPAFATFEAPARMEAIQKLASRALWWFRWAAVLTLVTGILIISTIDDMGDYFDSTAGLSILTGILLALVMFTNVWMFIWPNQRVVIASATQVVGGGQALPEAAAAGRRAFLPSRANAIFSIPMVWFMTMTSHWSGRFGITWENSLIYWIIVIALIAVVEASALGFLGGTGPGPLKWPFETVQNALITGFALWAVLYFIGWELLQAE